MNQPKIHPSSDTDWKDYYYNQVKKMEDKLKTLLAIIHRDGGHYTAKHGLIKSYHDACLISSERASKGRHLNASNPSSN